MREIINPGIRLFIITLVASALLAAVNTVTKPMIDENNRLAKENAMAEVLPGIEMITFDDEFALGTQTGVTSYCRAYSNGNPAGYAVFATRQGDQGPVSVVVGLNAQGVVLGVRIVSHSETAGLGANATNESFLSQYTGKSGLLSVTKNVTAGADEIVAITAATNTSRAVTDTVNDVMNYFRNELNGGGGL